ncbi:glycoside hydrolase family 43 protein [Hymenobacter lucidus]|uniref:Glycoside hydrolase family 43 protein n=1 Tax=Hymenobacter lucidus TaxID=2880930 RepID=A0ABS8ANT7_9BACT|nr:glycoside hydrolase family 43 protein [Hymenobacter lucidus]MCB2407858.1 glycoside hydrolase family 43 protein [Hymenobacter lucidus]
MGTWLRWSLLLLLLSLVAGSAPAQMAAPATATFTNPLLPAGADPWTVYHKGYYYYTHTTGINITLWKTKSLTQLATVPGQVVWTPPAAGPNSRDIWAPELHFIGGKWYLYYAADAGTNQTHRLWVLENSAADPTQGTWVSKGQLTDETNKWAIDGSVFEDQGRLYLLWSGWEGDTNGRQCIYIARLQNPWTVAGPRSKISTPVYYWERDGDLHDPQNPPHVDVNEGPQILRRGNRLFLVYSASGCWTDSYALGMLSATAGTDLLQPGAWAKSPVPVFRQDTAAGVYAPGHNSFFTSPDGRQSWILYHANSQPDQGCGNRRSPRMQPFTWHPDGTPNFGPPQPAGKPLPRPSGE